MTERPKLTKCTVRASAGKVEGGSGSHARVVKAPVPRIKMLQIDEIVFTRLIEIDSKNGQMASTDNR